MGGLLNVLLVLVPQKLSLLRLVTDCAVGFARINQITNSTENNKCTYPNPYLWPGRGEQKQSSFLSTKLHKLGESTTQWKNCMREFPSTL